MGGWLDGYVGGWVGEWVAGWMDGRTDGRTGGQDIQMVQGFESSSSSSSNKVLTPSLAYHRTGAEVVKEQS